MTDSRNVYDKLQSEVMSIKGAEKLANSELLSVARYSRVLEGLNNENRVLGPIILKLYGGSPKIVQDETFVGE